MKIHLAGRLIRARAGRPRAAAATLLALLLSLTPAVRARAAADLDPTFGSGGTVLTDFHQGVPPLRTGPCVTG